MSNEIDHWMTENIVCPHCGFEYENSDCDLEDSSGKQECEKCEKEFRWYAEYSVNFIT
jgi:hypothetical protein